MTNPGLLWRNFHCHGFILCDPQVLSIDIIAGSKITRWNVQCKNFVDGKLLCLILNWYINEQKELLVGDQNMYKDSGRSVECPWMRLEDVV